MCQRREDVSAEDLDPLRWVEDHGQALYHYALLRIGKTDLAEDLVQETFLTALHARERFAGRSSERTWLMGILQNKIYEYFRAVNKKKISEQEIIEDSSLSYFFDKSRHWKDMPLDWKTEPANIVDSREFWDEFHKCMGRLSEILSNAFIMREMDELDCDDICRELNITASCLWARLHRARLQLRQCLEQNWFLVR